MSKNIEERIVRDTNSTKATTLELCISKHLAEIENDVEDKVKNDI